ncbi:MAG: hypothetical protein IKU03_04395 [Bacteroidales bacterium]|nr:hypothetical protein [Bacteroidales bacterium]
MYPHDGQAAWHNLTLFFTRALLLLCFCWGLSPALQAQKGKSLTLEFSSNQNIFDLQHLSCDTNGLCVYYYSITDLTHTFHLLHYDLNFQLLHHDTYDIAENFVVEGASYSQDEAVILLQKRVKNKRSGEGYLFRYNFRKQQSDSLHIHGLPTNGILRMKCAPGLILFSSTTSNTKHNNLYFLTGNSTTAQGLSIPDARGYDIEDFNIDTATRRVVVGLKSTVNNKSLVWLCETDYERNPLFIPELPDSLQYRCESLRMTLLEDGHWMLAGTYENRANDITEGVYTLPYRDHEFDSLKHHPYSTSSILASNNSTYSHTGGTIVADGNRIAFITETLNPEYRDRPVYYYGVMTYEYSFYGYRYANADIFLFDSTGTEVWYYTFPYDDILSQQVNSYLQLSFIQDNILLYYVRGTDMVTMLTNTHDDILDSKRETSLFRNTGQYNDYSNVQLKRWHGDYYLLSGFKSNKSSGTYFIHKLWYR